MHSILSAKHPHTVKCLVGWCLHYSNENCSLAFGLEGVPSLGGCSNIEANI